MSFGKSPLVAVLGATLGIASAGAAGAQAPAPQTPASPTPARPGPQPQPAARSSAAPRASRFSISLSGAFAPTTSDFDATRRFTEFAEEGQIQSRYIGHRGPGFDAGLRFAWSSHWAISATFGLLQRKESATYTARIPHPLYLDRHREANATVDNLRLSETDGHLALTYLARSGGLDFMLFAGPSLFHLTSDLIEAVRYSQTYPYDTLMVTSVPTSSSAKTAFGFNVGASLERRLGGRVGLGAQVRYSLGQAKLQDGDQDTVNVNAGGLQVLAGLRFGL